MPLLYEEIDYDTAALAIAMIAAYLDDCQVF
jgi:hypothetical protein